MATHQHLPDLAVQEIATGTTFVHRLCAGEHEAHNWCETLVRCITGGQCQWPTGPATFLTRTDGPISRTAPYRLNRPAASDPYGQRVKGASALSIIRRVHQSSSVFAGQLPAGQPHAGPPSLCDCVFSSCAATATQPIQPVCANSACWSRLSAYHTAVVASSRRSPIAIDMLPSQSWLDRAQRLVGSDALSHVGFSTNFFFL